MFGSQFLHTSIAYPKSLPLSQLLQLSDLSDAEAQTPPAPRPRFHSPPCSPRGASAPRQAPARQAGCDQEDLEQLDTIGMVRMGKETMKQLEKLVLIPLFHG